MRRWLAAILLLWASSASARVINVEFKFTPFVGDPAKADHVDIVPGKAVVLVNRVPIAEQDIDKGEAMVLFEEREISPSLWLPVESLGPVLRKGKNTLRIEFTPTETDAKYRAHLRWASVLDQTSEESSGGTSRATNQADEGGDEREATGPVVFEREFTADFATDQAWHHAAPITALTAADEQALAKLVASRVALFKPNFVAAYAWLKDKPGVDVGKIRSAKCLEKAYAAGVRVVGPPADRLDLVVTGNPEILIRRKNAPLYAPTDPASFDRITDAEAQMCAAAALSLLFPPRLAVVRAPAGGWLVVY